MLEPCEVSVDILVHARSSVEHQGGRKLYKKLLDLGYYWLTMEANVINYASKCHECQVHGNTIQAPTVVLHSIITPWPFHSWVFDMVRPISPTSRGHTWIFAATNCFTKWVKVVPLKKATGLSTLYYPKENDQVEVTNKTLFKVLSRMVHDNPNIWHDVVPAALWAYRTFKLALDAQMDNDTLQMLELETLEGERDKAKKNFSMYQKRLSRAYDKPVGKKSFEVGDLAFRAVEKLEEEHQ
ncbi:RNase H family protein [Theobroma cacao]|uniref:RNase H family protein n=1 Tax=Theobroma cacao TaxID=3641 RepID=A0A061EN92_THECC|nr:RNase H family protein [Theobroma cacao]